MTWNASGSVISAGATDVTYRFVHNVTGGMITTNSDPSLEISRRKTIRFGMGL
jgi:hypothetical protein